jgi:hypothetical protein
LQPVTEALRKQQKGTVRKVAGGIHVGFLAVAVILLSWPDYQVPRRYIEGFSCLGLLEETGVLRKIAKEGFEETEAILKDSIQLIDDLESKRMDPE